ncbi:MAG: hypothetical protein IKO13_02340 [Oscillospiraceae bacterium]|nr:hypothetical protein [Oscillospiraceae bacterium]
MREKYDELKMEVIAFEEGIWTATADPANPANTGSGRQGGQNTVVGTVPADGTTLAP